MFLDSEVEKLRTTEEGIDEIFKEYKSFVTKIARRYFLVGADSDDVIQEGMIGLNKAVQTYDYEKNASFKTFATLCVNSQIQTAIKGNNTNKNKLLNEVMLEDNEEKMYFVISNEPNPEDKIISRENYKNLKAEILDKLSLLEKQILKQYLAGKKYEEISNMLCIDKKSVDNALNRIRKKLNYLL